MSAGDVDLNLLRVLAVLLETGSVARTAERLHVTPPAVSRSLGRLRRAVDDPLFVKSGRHLAPTPRALELRGEVQEALDRAVALLQPVAGDDPATMTARYTVSADDAVISSLGVELLQRARSEAPLVSIDFVSDVDEVAGLRTGSVHLDIGAHEDHPPQVEAELLMVDRFVAAVGAGHRFLATAPDPAAYAEARHVVVSAKGKRWGPVDDALAELGLERTSVSLVPSFGAAAHLVSVTDAVGLLPRALVIGLGARLGIATVEIPLDLPPLPVGQSWHRRYSEDPGQRGLRRLVRETAGDLFGSD